MDRTVLTTLGPNTKGGTREFHSLREYQAHVRGHRFPAARPGGKRLRNDGNVTALQGVAHGEHLMLHAPAQISPSRAFAPSGTWSTMRSVLRCQQPGDAS